MRWVWRQVRPRLLHHLEQRVLRLPVEAKLSLTRRLALKDPQIIDEIEGELRERVLRYLESWEP